MFICKLPFPADWEKRLQEVLLQHKSQKVYICSPCSAKSWIGIYRNMLASRAYMYYVWLHMETLAVAPHGYMPMLFDDNHQLERYSAMSAGSSILSHCSALYICGDKITQGMRSEIKAAAKRKTHIVLFNSSLQAEVMEILGDIRGSKRRFKLNPDHEELGMNATQLFEEVPESA